MRVAILTSEAVPFAKTGGLADVSGALPKALVQQDVDAKLILPLYDQIDRSMLNGGSVENVRVEWRGQIHYVRFWFSDAAGAPAYLLEAPEFFARHASTVTTTITFVSHSSRAPHSPAQTLDWQPDVVHGNDWPCGSQPPSFVRAVVTKSFSKDEEFVFASQRRLSGTFDAGDLWWLGFGDPPESDDFRLTGTPPH